MKFAMKQQLRIKATGEPVTVIGFRVSEHLAQTEYEVRYDKTAKNPRGGQERYWPEDALEAV